MGTQETNQRRTRKRDERQQLPAIVLLWPPHDVAGAVREQGQGDDVSVSSGYVFPWLTSPQTLGVKTEKKIGEFGGDIGAVWQVLTLSLRKPRSSLPKNQPFSQEMHLKIPLSSQGSEFSNSNPGCRILALYFFVKQITPMTFWHQAQSGKCFFQLLIPRLTCSRHLKARWLGAVLFNWYCMHVMRKCNMIWNLNLNFQD
jgi:hypothetical protein